MTDKGQVTLQSGIGRDGIVRVGTEGVVDRVAVACPQSTVVTHHRQTSAVSENKIVLWDQLPKRITQIGFYSGQRGRRINIPKSNLRPRRPTFEDTPLEQLIVGPDAAVL